MTEFDKQKLTEIVLYILNEANGLDYYHVFKVIYFANISLLAKYGVSLTSDEFCALPDGPVPSLLYNCIKKSSLGDKDLESILDKNIDKGDEDAYYMLTAKREADLNYLSKADKEELDKSISENAYLPYWELKRKSHGNEWKRAFYSDKQGRKIMNVIGMAKDGHATEPMLEYIKENLDIVFAMS